jgi:hypothetical protein
MKIQENVKKVNRGQGLDENTDTGNYQKAKEGKLAAAVADERNLNAKASIARPMWRMSGNWLRPMTCRLKRFTLLFTRISSP